ncbi:MAG: hypothetical protein ABIQ31_23405 [Ferruginibacter sp.]
MKKLATILTGAVMLFSTFAFAIDGEKANLNVSARIKASFSKDFSTASNISWEKIKTCYIATFTINTTEINAAYNDDGELVGTSREIETVQLPICVSLALSKKYNGYNFSKKALELTFDGITNYYLAVENDQQVLKLKCSVSGGIDVESKVKKK